MSELSVGQLRGLTVNDNVITVPSGHTLYAPGSVVQVVTTTKTDVFTTSSLTYTTVTGLTATITPKSTNSKILVMAQIAVGGRASQTGPGFFKVTRGGTDFYIGNTDGSRTRAVFGGYAFAELAHMLWSQSIIAEDSPGSTAALTYRVETMVNNSFWASHVNRSGDDANSGTVARGASSITVMEIAQ